MGEEDEDGSRNHQKLVGVLGWKRLQKHFRG